MNKHERILRNKYDSTKDSNLKICIEELEKFKKEINKEKILEKKQVLNFVKLFNNYRNKTAFKYENRKNSGQELIRSSMLEGFFEFLFNDLILTTSEKNKVVFGSAKTIVGFNFSPFSFNESFNSLNLNLLEKDQDFVIGIRSKISINDDDIHDIVIPFIIIECKVYIEKNMLETHMNSCANVKKIVPECKYFVVSEYMKMKTAEPQLSKLDNVYILCQETNSNREKKQNKNEIKEFNANLIYEIFDQVKKHLEKRWWDTDSITRVGKIISPF